jgi:hypothetical protein
LVRVGVFALLLFGAAALAHETWLMPSQHIAKVGEEVRLGLTSGMDFPGLGSPIRPERVAKASYRLGGENVDLNALEAQEKSLVTIQAFSKEGVATVWIDLKPRDIELTDEQVEEYLDEIGATDEIRRIWAARKGRVPWRETYTKHVKTFVVVGDPGEDRSWEVPAGMALEIVPVSSPLAAQRGEKFSVRVLADGEPLASFPIGLMMQGMAGRAFQTTDTDGRATFELEGMGDALIFAVRLRLENDGISWKSDFTTMTFHAQQAK